MGTTQQQEAKQIPAPRADPLPLSIRIARVRDNIAFNDDDSNNHLIMYVTNPYSTDNSRLLFADMILREIYFADIRIIIIQFLWHVSSPYSFVDFDRVSRHVRTYGDASHGFPDVGFPTFLLTEARYNQWVYASQYGKIWNYQFQKYSDTFVTDMVMLYVIPLFLASRSRCVMTIQCNSMRCDTVVLFRYLLEHDPRTTLSKDEKCIQTSNGSVIKVEYPLIPHMSHKYTTTKSRARKQLSTGR